MGLGMGVWKQSFIEARLEVSRTLTEYNVHTHSIYTTYEHTSVRLIVHNRVVHESTIRHVYSTAYLKTLSIWY
jgi:hypothetical protein